MSASRGVLCPTAHQHHPTQYFGVECHPDKLEMTSCPLSRGIPAPTLGNETSNIHGKKDACKALLAGEGEGGEGEREGGREREKEGYLHEWKVASCVPGAGASSSSL
jgi:hypothetical protein